MESLTVNGDRKIILQDAYILAGGKSKRMGEDKRNVLFKEKTLLETAIENLNDIFENVTIVVNSNYPPALNNVRIISDIIPDKGPLGGIYTALKDSGKSHIFIVAADMPYVKKDVVLSLLSNASPSYDIIYPVHIDKNKKETFEPLHAFYSQNCISYIKKMLDDGCYQINALFSELENLKILPVKSEEETSFININTRNDLIKARAVKY